MSNQTAEHMTLADVRDWHRYMQQFHHAEGHEMPEHAHKQMAEAIDTDLRARESAAAGVTDADVERAISDAMRQCRNEGIAMYDKRWGIFPSPAAWRAALEAYEAGRVREGAQGEAVEILGWNDDCTPRLRINVKLHELPPGTKLYTAPGSAQGEAVAYVPVHPTHGPLWMDTYAAGTNPDRARYPRMPLYTAPPASAVPSWLPIETAPKDGTVVLALLADSDVPHSIRFRERIGWVIAWDDYRIKPHDGPLCWMPLPPAPIQQEAAR